MTSQFIPHKTPKQTVDDIVANFDAFYADFSISEFRQDYRVDDTVTDNRIKDNLVTAMVFINNAIATWRGEQTTVLSDEQSHLYKRSIYCRTKIYVIEQHQDIDTTNDGTASVETIEHRLSVEKQREREAIRLLTGKGRITVELV